MHGAGVEGPESVGRHDGSPGISDFLGHMAIHAQPLDPSSQLCRDLVSREGWIAVGFQKIRAHPVDGADGGACGGAFVEGQQMEGTDSARAVSHDGNGCGTSPTVVLLAWLVGQNVLDPEAHGCNLFGIGQGLSRFDPSAQPTFAGIRAGRPDIVDIAGRVLDYGAVYALCTVQAAELVAVSRSGHGNVGHGSRC